MQVEDKIDDVSWSTALEELLGARSVGGVGRYFVPPPLPVLVDGEDEVEVIVARIDGLAWSFYDQAIIGGRSGEVGISRESSRAWPWRVNDGWRSWGGITPPGPEIEPIAACRLEQELEDFPPGPNPALRRRDVLKAVEQGTGRLLLEVGSERLEVSSRRRFFSSFGYSQPSSKRIPRGRSTIAVLSWPESACLIPSRVLLGSPEEWIIDDIRLNGKSVLREDGATANPLGLPGHLFAASSCEVELCRDPVKGGVVEVTARYDGEDPQGGCLSAFILAEDPEISVAQILRFVGRIGGEE